MFIDSMQFMNSSLDKLVKNLSDKDFKYLVEEFGSKNLELLKQKGGYPYEYMNSFEGFNEEKLSPKKYFYRSIKERKIGDDGHIDINDYLTCEKTWDKFEMKNMSDHHDHYLKKDALLLADVSEKFIDTCLKYYGLDPCHYFSSPGLSWYAMLCMLKSCCFFSGSNGKSLCNSCNSSGYSRSTSKKYPIELLSLIDISNLSIFSNHLNLPQGR